MSNSKISGEEEKEQNPPTERNERSNYWKKIVSRCEKRNASLERKQAALIERVRFMECALPSILMGAVVNTKRQPEVSKSNASSCSHCCPSDEKSLTSFDGAHRQPHKVHAAKGRITRSRRKAE